MKWDFGSENSHFFRSGVQKVRGSYPEAGPVHYAMKPYGQVPKCRACRMRYVSPVFLPHLVRAMAKSAFGGPVLPG